MPADRKKILLIDDDPVILEVLELLLGLEGYTVLSSLEGERGVNLAKKHLPDLIILDINMPKMSGYMVTTLLSKHEQLKDVPIILLTATAQIAGNITLSVPGVHCKIAKPFNNEELLNSIKNLVANKN